MGQIQAIGDHLRSWRQRRRMSQLDLACEADISTRHVSFLETGRARPSRDMVLHLAERLDVSRQSVNAIETGKYDPSLPLAFKIARLFETSIEAIFQDAP